MLPEKRRNEILRLNKENQGIKLTELAESLNVSSMTILRDIKKLAKDGLVEVVRGGIIPVRESTDNTVSLFEKRHRKFIVDKQRLMQYCAEYLVSENDLVILDGSTTTSGIIRCLSGKMKLTIFTNSLFVLNESLNKTKDSSKIITSGGLLDKNYLLFTGPEVEKFYLSKLTDVVFLGAAGFDFSFGTMDSNYLEVQAKKAMCKSASKRVLVVDHSKFEMKSVSNAVSFNDITDVVTNVNASEKYIEMIKQKYPHIVIHLV